MIDLSQIRHIAQERSTAPLVRVLAKTGLTPNTLTLLGFLVSLGAGVVIALGYKYNLLIGGFLILFSGAFDLFDGALARAKGKVTKFGALLDSSLDRLSEAVVLLGLLVFCLAHHLTWEVVLIYIALIGSMLVSYIRARAEGVGVKCEVGIFTRAERITFLALGLLLASIYTYSILITLSILSTLALVTVVQRLIYVWQKAKGEQ